MQRIPFYECEVKVSALDGVLDIATPVTPKENFKALFEGKNPLWFPMTYDNKGITPRIEADNRARAFITDGETPVPKEEQGGPDMFGVEWVYVPVAGGSMVKPGKPMLEDACDWKEVIKFPNVNEWDWEASAAANKEFVKTDKILTWTFLNGTMYERLISFMDFEGAAMALIDEDQKEAVKELMNEILEKVYFPYLENIAKYFPEVDMISLHDDWGAQRAPFFSLATAREMFVPILKKFAAKCKELGFIFQLHSCGANELLVPAYIEGDVQMWNGMAVINDKLKYYNTWGQDFVFGVDPPSIASDPNADPEDLEIAAKDFCETYIRDGKVHAVASVMRANPYFIECVYKISRQMLNA
ncbi:MAG: methyltransferase [Anaerofustis stercorihominis]|nr:methyltransferase [Anaerofustis stercorihominis]